MNNHLGTDFHLCPVQHECLPTSTQLTREQLLMMLKFLRTHREDTLTVRFCKSGLNDEYSEPGLYAWLFDDMDQEGPVLHLSEGAVYPT